jgi:hypothetical protein
VLTFAAVAALAAAGAEGHAAAAEVQQSGWWTSVPVAGPTAPADSLLVQGGPDANAPIAYAGISFSLSEGETPSALKLTVNTSGGNTPNAKLQLCRASGDIGGDAGGDAAKGPKFDCSAKSEASASADGASYEFKDGLSSLAGTGTFAVVVLPTQPTDRVVLNKPNGSALQTESSGSSLSDSSSDFSSDSTSLGGTSDTSSGSSFSTPGSASFDVPPAPLPSATGDAARAGSSDTELPSAAPAQTIADQQPSDGRSIKPWIFGGLAAAAAALWTLAGRASDEPLTAATTETD